MDKTTVEKCLVTLSIEHQWNGNKTGENIFIVFFVFVFFSDEDHLHSFLRTGSVGYYQSKKHQSKVQWKHLQNK